jgi:hypothetical protein
MKKFSDLGIQPALKSFTGDKIKPSKILNREIVVEDYRIDDSKFHKDQGKKCLCLQIRIGESRHVVFTGSTVLMEMIQRIPLADFPFTTTIIEENDRYQFS